MINCSFINHYADSGGGIYNSRALNVTIFNSTFINNDVTTHLRTGGSAIMNPDGDNMTIINSSFG
ncbi:hypothetical protein ALNOE001_06690 [Candidatus Methanobinarius endosymbioticus]|uniref:Right handed beta helix domain-containing protein n=1 Tax=Candidatus Methanobinarius endosymbioticus TaxID=2006182 RepID=A0A366MDK8_9EURY|nr:hypothetical protein ALNOE001_06690 [Candidatus Methanobinarius endosymbioticus]